MLNAARPTDLGSAGLRRGIVVPPCRGWFGDAAAFGAGLAGDLAVLPSALVWRIIVALHCEYERHTMTAFNVVRFRVKSGREQEFLDAHNKVADWSGLKHVNMIKTGERTYCIIAEWTDMDALAKARPNMIATLDSFRDTLEDLGGGLGVSDPVSGPVVLALK
jgi:hypothetical protein